MLDLLQCVETTQALPEVGVRLGQRGTIVEVYTFPRPAYEVEFCNDRGETLAMLALQPSQVKLYVQEPMAA